jgi:transcriptional regulator with PAS, ATPase and Fis domain
MILHDVGDVIVQENLPSELILSAIKTQVNAEAVKGLDDILPRLTEGKMEYGHLVGRILKDTKKKILIKALEMSGENKTKAATLLGISRYKFMREQKKADDSI